MGICNTHMRLGSKIPQQQQEIVDEALEETSFQFASAEVFRCPNGCGELSYDRHDKVSEENKKIAAVLGVLMIVADILIGDGRLFLLGLVAIGYFLFATGETTAYFYCMKCRAVSYTHLTLPTKRIV